MKRAYIGIGSNLGDREATIRQAVDQLAELPDTKLVRLSSLYDSDPVGLLDQAPFLNAVAMLETELTPRQLLWNLNLVEHRLGRQRTRHWGPRTMDLDILFYSNLVLDEPDLVIPHPEVENRAFVLIPLGELDPFLPHPRTGLVVSEMLKNLKSYPAVRRRGRLW
jgi:2-amino-4-hydroxy-6-hydroxymethyldihydropteridine diphosphokinase